jgi:selenocysteine-specific translation elongation factor
MIFYERNKESINFKNDETKLTNLIKLIKIFEEKIKNLKSIDKLRNQLIDYVNDTTGDENSKNVLKIVIDKCINVAHI